MRWKLDLRHRGVDILAVIHVSHGLVVHVLNCGVQPIKFSGDRVRADDGLVVPDRQNLRFEGAYPLDCGAKRSGLSVFVSSDGDEVRNVAEERSEEIAHDGDSRLGEPDDDRLVGFATRNPHEFEIDAA